MKTLSYVLGREEEIKIGRCYYFGQLWDGNGNGDILLNDRCVSLDENIIIFEVIEESENILNTLVEVTDIS